MSIIVTQSDNIDANFSASSSSIPSKIWHSGVKDYNFLFNPSAEESYELLQLTFTDNNLTWIENNETGLDTLTSTSFNLEVLDPEYNFLLNYLSDLAQSLTLTIPLTGLATPLKLLGNCITLTPGVGLFYFGNPELIIANFQETVALLAQHQHIQPSLVFSFLQANTLEQDDFSQDYCVYFLQLPQETLSDLVSNGICPVGIVMKHGNPRPSSMTSTILKEGFHFTAQTKTGDIIQPIKIFDNTNIASFYLLEFPLRYNTTYYNFSVMGWENDDENTASNGEIHCSALDIATLNNLALFCNSDALYELLLDNLVEDNIEDISITVNDLEDSQNTTYSNRELIFWRVVENQYLLQEGYLQISYNFSYEVEEHEPDPGGGDDPGGDEPYTPELDETDVLLYSSGLMLNNYEEVLEEGSPEGEIVDQAYRVICSADLSGDYAFLTAVDPANYIDNVSTLLSYQISSSTKNEEDNFIFDFDSEPSQCLYAFSFVSEQDFLNSGLETKKTLELHGIRRLWRSCLSPDTLITLADYSQKAIQDLTLNDLVLSKNHTAQKILKIEKSKISDMSIYYYFDDGTVIHTTNPHRFFNIEQGFYQYLHKWHIGEHTQKVDGTTPALIYKEERVENSLCCGVWTEDCTCWANGLLSSETAANEELLQTMDLLTAKQMLKSIVKERLRGVLQ